MPRTLKFILPVFILVLLPTAAWSQGPQLYGTPQSSATSSGTSVTVAIPNAGLTVLNGTLIVVTAMDRSGAPNIATPAGYTKLSSFLFGAGNLEELAVFYQQIAVSGVMPSTVVISDGSASWIGGTAAAYQNYNTAAPFDGSAVTSSTTGGAPFVATGITTGGSNEIVGWAFGVLGDVGTGSITNSKGTQQAVNGRAATGAAFYSNYTDLAVAAAGATGTNSLTFAGSATTAGAIAFAIASGPGPVISTTSPLSFGGVGTSYRQVLAATTGTPAYTWAVSSGSPPGGLSLSSSGILSGTPNFAGTTTFDIKVTDSIPTAISKTFTVTIVPAGQYIPPLTDAYGGYLSVACTNTNTAFSIVTVNTNRKAFCTPAGHVFFLRSISVFDLNIGSSAAYDDESNQNYQGYALAKYGNATNWYAGELLKTNAWGMNGLLIYHNPNLEPSVQSTTKLPFGVTQIVSTYSAVNQSGWGSGYAKDLYFYLGKSGATTTWGGFVSGNGLIDYRDPAWTAMATGSLNQTFGPQNARPYFLGILTDDSDSLHGFGAGPDFATQPAGKNDFRLGYVAFFLPPVSYANPIPAGYSQVVIYANGQLYMKARFQALEKVEFPTIGALNTAWGSSYTTYESSGTCVGTQPTGITCTTTVGTPDTIGTGNGATLTFSNTLSNTTVSHFSLGIFISGVLVGGDTGTGNLVGTGCGGLTGTINYGTGAVSITCTTPPANAAAITAVYMANAWGIGTGFMDEDCRAGHSAYCGTGTSSVTTYLTGIPAAVQADINALTKDTASYYASTYNADLQAWGLANGFTGHIPYLSTTGVGSWADPPDRYVIQGFCGNMDAFALPGPEVWPQAKVDFVNTYCPGQPIIALTLRLANPQSPLSWPNSTCTHSGASVTCAIATPSNFPRVQSLSNHIDVSCNFSDYEVSQVAFSSTVSTVTYTASGTPIEASATCNVYVSQTDLGTGITAFANQAARAADFQSKVTAFASSAYSATGIHPVIGYTWWSLFDNWLEGLSYGAETVRGNAYDGVEDVNAVVACPYGLGAYNCGGELTVHNPPLGNVISALESTNMAIDNAIINPPSLLGVSTGRLP